MPLKQTDVELIAGFPHLQFGHVPSPFSLTPLEQVLEQLRRRGRRDEPAVLSNVLTQRVGFAARPVAPAVSLPAAAVMGEAAEDLYFYRLPQVSLKKGERGYYPLFAGRVPYEHLYTWDIPDYIDEQNRYRDEQSEKLQIVWHALKLTNTTGNPWTTAAAMTIQDGRVLGQDTVRYTPPRASTELKITQAVAIDAQQNEYEIERRRNAANYHGRSYDLVTIKGELAVTNYKDQPIALKTTKALSGEVHGADGDPEIVKLARGLRQVNPRSQLVWQIDVPPGRDETVQITYTYQVYTRN
jgi:hypothetical protein